MTIWVHLWCPKKVTQTVFDSEIYFTQCPWNAKVKVLLKTDAESIMTYPASLGKSLKITAASDLPEHNSSARGWRSHTDHFTFRAQIKAPLALSDEVTGGSQDLLHQLTAQWGQSVILKIHWNCDGRVLCQTCLTASPCTHQAEITTLYSHYPQLPSV